MAYYVAIVRGDHEELIKTFDDKNKAMVCGKETFEKVHKTVICYKTDETKKDAKILLKTWY